MPVATPTPSLSAVLIAATIMVMGPMAGWAPAYALVMGPLLALAFFTDAIGRILPDVLTAAIALAGLTLSACGLAAPLEHVAIIGVMICLGAILIRTVAVWWRGPGAFCLGDVKLLMACGFAVPPAYIAGSFIMAAPMAVLWLMFTPRLSREDAAHSLPFGSVVVAGLAATIVTVAATLSISPNNDFLWSLGF